MFGTKAETLHSLKDKLNCVIPKFIYFSVAEWQHDPNSVRKQIKSLQQPLVVRSSAGNEDTADSSCAGQFTSVLNVAHKDLDHAIDQVIDGFDSTIGNQVIVQEMITDATVSGVIMTRNIDNGAPYYVVSYDDETGRTDTVTSGSNIHKTVYVHRSGTKHIRSPRLQAMIKLALAVERQFDYQPVDIEFGLSETGTVYLFQVRQIATQKTWDVFINGRVDLNIPQSVPDTILCNMADWNPAEMIGPMPRPLALSLYSELITDTIWSKARQNMGYTHVSQPLMHTVAGRCFIDVKASIRSFMPAILDPDIADRVVAKCLNLLANNPKYHDKIEFEIVPTCASKHSLQKIKTRFGDVLSDRECKEYQSCLENITEQNIDCDCVALSEQDILHLDTLTNPTIQDIKQYGTLPFAQLARHAFIAETILRDVLEPQRLDQFKQSLHTVTKDIVGDMNHLQPQEFMLKYGHLRPSSYDITSLRYDQRQNVLGNTVPVHEDTHFEFSQDELVQLPELFHNYAVRAIQGREQAKFVFTKHLSNLLENIADCNYTREQLSFVSLHDLDNPLLAEISGQNKQTYEWMRELVIGPIIRDISDVHVVPTYRAVPNFITDKTVEAEIVFVQAHTDQVDLQGKIACIESADPGFDWLFGKGIVGLITRFGGVNSHMSIRCAEFGLPAAIGCGEMLFTQAVNAHTVVLDAGAGVLTCV